MASHEDYLAQEYAHLQRILEDFDTKTLTVKAWSVTFSAAAIGFAYDKGQAAILVVSIASALSFLVVECMIKVNQQAFYDRINRIEAHFAGAGYTHTFQTAKEWKAAFEANGEHRRVLEVICWPHVFMPHLAIAIVAAGLLLFHPPMVTPLPAKQSQAGAQPAAVVSSVPQQVSTEVRSERQ